MEFRADAALLDIEGTLGSMAFVHSVLFPFARERMDEYVRAHACEPDVRMLLDSAATIAGVSPDDLDGTLRALQAWSDEDRKVAPLKELQGRIWAEGYESSHMRGHLYPDSIDALRRFHSANITLYIYSSGSIAAQRLFFGYSVFGDITPLFSGFFDTTIGSKRDPQSYSRIAREIGVAPSRILFFSDSTPELDAARATTIQTLQVARPEDGPIAESTHPVAASFDGVVITRT